MATEKDLLFIHKKLVEALEKLDDILDEEEEDKDREPEEDEEESEDEEEE